MAEESEQPKGTLALILLYLVVLSVLWTWTFLGLWRRS